MIYIISEVRKKQHLLITNGYKFIDYYDGMIGKLKVNYTISFIHLGYLIDMAADPITGIYIYIYIRICFLNYK